MTDDGVTDGFTETLCDGAVTIEVSPIGGGEVRLTVEYGGTVIESSEYTREVFTKPTPRGTFLNAVRDGLEPKSGVDAGEVRQEVKEWCAEMAELGEEEEEKMLPGDIQRILSGTHYPVEVYNGEPTTWNVTLTFDGRTCELEFTAGEMIGNSGAPLQEKIANEFFEKIEVEAEDWEKITDRWMGKQTVVHMSDESTSDAVAKRVVDYIGDGLIPVDERDQMQNDVAAVWYDGKNEAGYKNADPKQSIAWVQDTYVVDQLESAEKTIEYKGQIVKDLISRGDMLGSTSKRRWIGDNGSTDKFYPFDPTVLGVSEEDVTMTGDADEEVDI